jgi:hypothetical protein
MTRLAHSQTMCVTRPLATAYISAPVSTANSAANNGGKHAANATCAVQRIVSLQNRLCGARARQQARSASCGNACMLCAAAAARACAQAAAGVLQHAARPPLTHARLHSPQPAALRAYPPLHRRCARAAARCSKSAAAMQRSALQRTLTDCITRHQPSELTPPPRPPRPAAAPPAAARRARLSARTHVRLRERSAE